MEDSVPRETLQIMSDIDKLREEAYKRILRERGVEKPCIACRGLGTRSYSSTATWRGGMGGAMITKDVCDVCWGTGDKYRHGANLREMQRKYDGAVAKEAVTLLSRSAGYQLSVCHLALKAICDELERLSRGRKRPPYFGDLCLSLAKTLRKGLTTRPKHAHGCPGAGIGECHCGAESPNP